MLQALRGRVVEVEPGQLTLATGGVEWLIDISPAVQDLLPALGATMRVYIYLLHREDAMRLYGFASRIERDFFVCLLNCPGVGVKLAMQILRTLSMRQFIAAVEEDNCELLKTVPGLGEKSAAKLIVQLRGKLDNFIDKAAKKASSPVQSQPEEDELIQSLVAMGFQRRNVQTVVAEILTTEQNVSEHELLRRAIIKLRD